MSEVLGRDPMSPPASSYREYRHAGTGNEVWGEGLVITDARWRYKHEDCVAGSRRQDGLPHR